MAISCEDLVELVQAGQPEAFAELYARYERYLFRQASRIVGAADAEEVVQETFCAAYKSIPKFEARAKFATWITRIAINVALQHRRKKQRRPIEAFPDNTVCRKPPVEEQVQDRRVLPWLEQAMAALPNRQRAVFILCVMQDFAQSRASRILNVCPARVKSRLHRARVRLREDYATADESKT